MCSCHMTQRKVEGIEQEGEEAEGEAEPHGEVNTQTRRCQFKVKVSR